MGKMVQEGFVRCSCGPGPFNPAQFSRAAPKVCPSIRLQIESLQCDELCSSPYEFQAAAVRTRALSHILPQVCYPPLRTPTRQPSLNKEGRYEGE